MKVEHISEKDFESIVLKSDKPVLVDFYATWCGPCKQLAPILEQIAEERPDVRIVKVDVDESADLASSFGVVSIPTLIYFKNGEVVSQTVGARNKRGLEMLLV